MPKLQSLYIESTRVEQVLLDKGSIKLIHRDYAPRWFPLKRLSRIVTFGTVFWDSSAINACMECFISLTFSSQQGQIKGICQSINAKQSCFGEMLTEVITQINGSEKLDGWFIAMQRQCKVKSIEKIHVITDDFDSKKLRTIFINRVEKYHKKMKLKTFSTCLKP